MFTAKLMVVSPKPGKLRACHPPAAAGLLCQGPAATPLSSKCYEPQVCAAGCWQRGVRWSFSMGQSRRQKRLKVPSVGREGLKPGAGAVLAGGLGLS